MREEEAKEKWCPFSRQLGTLTSISDGEIVSMGTQNRGHQMGGPLQNCMCIGSACMAWRWEGAEGGRMLNPTNKDHPGYCGLAGKP